MISRKSLIHFSHRREQLPAVRSIIQYNESEAYTNLQAFNSLEMLTVPYNVHRSHDSRRAYQRVLQSRRISENCAC